MPGASARRWRGNEVMLAEFTTILGKADLASKSSGRSSTFLLRIGSPGCPCTRARCGRRTSGVSNWATVSLPAPRDHHVGAAVNGVVAGTGRDETQERFVVALLLPERTCGALAARSSPRAGLARTSAAAFGRRGPGRRRSTERFTWTRRREGELHDGSL